MFKYSKEGVSVFAVLDRRRMKSNATVSLLMKSIKYDFDRVVSEGLIYEH